MLKSSLGIALLAIKEKCLKDKLSDVSKNRLENFEKDISNYLINNAPDSFVDKINQDNSNSKGGGRGGK